MARKQKRPPRKPWTNQQVRDLRQGAKLRKSVATLAKVFKRTQGALRQKAFELGLPLGHRQRTKRRR